MFEMVIVARQKPKSTTIEVLISRVKISFLIILNLICPLGNLEFFLQTKQIIKKQKVS
jgi:hypothetical protein